ncbi:HTH-type transcriptional regulator [Pluralibacter gergoviae]|uniref:HTH-type transcriptional regulator n=1 Tax=Pluralibacter gergoviae TaxID=61647 RepID=UPI0004F78992|nr:HTH-type transcriptional regulator [Pluralibacter gergoviae]AIQ98752.1 transcriptional regulator [Pluralibacter gergoviae]EKV0929713.1 HTH-type transcriptional regulator [Pluralibacter gergoviae]EKV6247715.1 HTH-type transcriptional regulator [Pluralibacter gergoviae]EKW6620622.1 HTH-type transcriptional regulator [Pluralibacter gergoviae]ELD4272893.1 HTH-type transcriptional regulator [Pluralibacter gergoviae]
MEYKDPMHELLSSLEQIVFKDDVQAVTLNVKPTAFTEFDQLLANSGLKADEFARAMGISAATVREWQSRREKPSASDLRLMRLIQTSSAPGKRIA